MVADLAVPVDASVRPRQAGWLYAMPPPRFRASALFFAVSSSAAAKEQRMNQPCERCKPYFSNPTCMQQSPYPSDADRSLRASFLSDWQILGKDRTRVDITEYVESYELKCRTCGQAARCDDAWPGGSFLAVDG
ncbi:MAG: hypothetical protein Q8O67_34060 [Deltaproteobacteria bacterium]|nr:hypothetical protein [Deltaproteobacteria bacterium]